MPVIPERIKEKLLLYRSKGREGLYQRVVSSRIVFSDQLL